MKRISIFVGFKVAEVVSFCILIYGLAWLGWVFDQVIDGIGHECQFTFHAFPDFFMFVFFAFMIIVMFIAGLIIAGFLIYLLYLLIKKNWEWSGKV